MCKDTITVWRNEFNSVMDNIPECDLSAEKTVAMALELENKIRSYEKQRRSTAE